MVGVGRTWGGSQEGGSAAERDPGMLCAALLYSSTLPGLSQLYGDETILLGAHFAKHWHLKHASDQAPVYLYYFTLDAYGIMSFLLGAKSLKGRC